MKTLFNGVLLATCLFAPAVRAADLTQLIQDVYRYNHAERIDTLAYWLPAEFWDEQWKNSPYMSDDDRRRTVKILKQYTIIAVMSGRVYRSTLQPISREEIVKNLEVHQNGDLSLPLEEAEMPEELQSLLGRLKATMENTLGQTGKGFELFVVSNVNVDRRILDPREKGVLKLQVDDVVFEWKLPLASLLLPKLDPKTGESFPGTYNYNPYTGDKLTTAAAPAAK